ncbi:hypothetical protein ALC60_03916, partial [Trachymyrmex zeteki]
VRTLIEYWFHFSDTHTIRKRICPTVFPALSSPKINTKYSSFCIKYLYKPCSNVYISVNRRCAR